MASQYPPKIRSADWNYGGPKWKLSRSKIDLFMECPMCFYLDNKLGVSRPKMPAFTLNVAVDALLKKEFDFHRKRGSKHPLMEEYGVNALPYVNENMETWRDNFQGILYKDEKTGLLISGAVDDVWINENNELIIVDYKATSKEGSIETLDDSAWQIQYRRQMEIYQWLFRKNGFSVSNKGYFVYVNGDKDKEAFDKKLEFEVTLIEHIGNDSWIPKTIENIKECLDSDTMPDPNPTCDYCGYRKLARDVQMKHAKK